MQEASKPEDNFLQATLMDEEFKEYFPEKWHDLPSIPASSGVLDDGTRTKCLAFMKRCKSDKATSEEIQDLVHKIQATGEPVAWMAKLANIKVPEWPEGKDPTVKEFFEGNFSPAEMKVSLVLVAYPHFATENK